MKHFKQLIKELPSNKVVAAFGQFQPPTAGYEHLVKAVQTIANKADHVIYASANEDKKLNPLPVDRKVYFLKRMFSEANFQAANGFESITEMATHLNTKYKHLTVVTFDDKVSEYETQLKENNGKLYNFETIKVISVGEVNPDSSTVSVVSGVKMCESAKSGDFNQFKKGVPHTLTELDSRRLMNDVRKGMGLEPIRENVLFERTKIREQYVAGKIFNVGDKVKDADGVYEIMDRGANYLTVVNESGELSKKWIDKVTLSKAKIKENLETNANEICFKNYTTANFNKNPKVFHAFKGTISRWEQGGIEDGVAVLNAIKHTDSYLSMVDGKDRTSEAEKAKQALNRIGEYQSHNYWDDHKVITTDDVMAKHNSDLQDAIKKQVKEESEVMDSKKIAKKYKDFLNKAGSAEKPVEIAEPAAGKQMSVLKNKEQKLKNQDQNDLPEAYQSSSGPSHGHAYGGTGFKRPPREDDEGWDREPKHKQADVPHAVHINGKKWKSFGSQSHATNVAKKIKGATVHKEEVELEEATTGATKVVHTRTGADGAKYHIMQDSPTDFSVHREHNGKTKHIDTYGSLHRAKSVLDNEVKESVEIQEGAYEKSEENKRSADSAKKQGDMFAHHLHMSDHHENLSQWHTEKGRHSVADIHAQKAEQHHEKAMALKEETIDEVSSELLNRYKEKAKKSADDLSSKGQYKKSTDRWSNVMKATGKQIDKTTASIKKTLNKEDVYSSDTKTKKVQVQDKDGNWVFKDKKFHPRRINFGASKMNGKPAQVDDPTKMDTTTAYQKYQDDQKKKVKTFEAWVLNPSAKSKKKSKEIKDNETAANLSSTAPFDAFSNTNNQT